MKPTNDITSMPRIAITLVLILLTSCSAPFAAQPTALPPLPTVTPMPTRGPATAVPPTPTARPTATPLPATALATALPSFTQAVTETADGPINEPMAALKLGAEPYAALGDPAAPITIIEFADHGCPYCRTHALTVFPMLRQEFIDTGEVYYVYKDLPIISVHGDMAAEAAQCAGAQGDYWDMAEQLALSSDEWNGAVEAALEAFGRYAEKIGIDAAELQRCVQEERYKAGIDADVDDATRLGIQSTPIFVINHKVMIGSRDPAVFADIIEQELQEVKASAQ